MGKISTVEVTAMLLIKLPRQKQIDTWVLCVCGGVFFFCELCIWLEPYHLQKIANYCHNKSILLGKLKSNARIERQSISAVSGFWSSPRWPLQY